jgi:hypothetical protein
LDVWFSRLDSGRAILEDLPHVDSPGSSLVVWRRNGGGDLGKAPGLGKGKLGEIRVSGGKMILSAVSAKEFWAESFTAESLKTGNDGKPMTRNFSK